MRKKLIGNIEDKKRDNQVIENKLNKQINLLKLISDFWKKIQMVILQKDRRLRKVSQILRLVCLRKVKWRIEVRENLSGLLCQKRWKICLKKVLLKLKNFLSLLPINFWRSSIRRREGSQKLIRSSHFCPHKLSEEDLVSNFRDSNCKSSRSKRQRNGDICQNSSRKT